LEQDSLEQAEDIDTDDDIDLAEFDGEETEDINSQHPKKEDIAEL
jgi:hypothetical protein